MKTPHKHAELIKAWADGAEIEYWSGTLYGWRPAYNPNWDEKTEYRIKPEPKQDVVHEIKVWVGGNAREKVVLHMYNSETHKAHGSNLRLTFDGETGKLKKAEVIE